MSDPVVMRYITNIIANAKKNDAKTAAELEMFKNELGLWDEKRLMYVQEILPKLNLKGPEKSS